MDSLVVGWMMIFGWLADWMDGSMNKLIDWLLVGWMHMYALVGLMVYKDSFVCWLKTQVNGKLFYLINGWTTEGC